MRSILSTTSMASATAGLPPMLADGVAASIVPAADLNLGTSADDDAVSAVLLPLPTLPPLGTSRAADTLGRATEATLQLRACLWARGTDLVDLAGWLGGPVWQQHARDPVVAVLGGQAFTRRTRVLIEQSWRLFALRLVDDLEGAAAGRFVCLDPRDERVGRCCEYAELLERTHLAIAAVDIGARRARRRVCRPARRAG